jgi:hypothetical protein
MVSPTLPLPQPNVPLFSNEGKPTQAGYEFLDRLQSVVKQINAAVAALSFAPTGAQYVVGAADATLTAERVATSTTSVIADMGTAAQALFKRAALSGDVTAAQDSNSVTVDKVSAAFSFAGIVTPAQITADQNDYNPTGLATANVLRISSDAARSITGIAAQGTGRFLFLFNVGAFAITLTAEDAASAAANRFSVPAAPIISANGSRAIWYDITSSRWRAFTS